MISRTIRMDTLNDIEVAMSRAPVVFQDEASKILFQVLMTKPRSEMIKRTPMATTRRWTNYIGADGKSHRVNRTAAGKVKALRNAVSNGVKVSTTGEVEFGVRANAQIPYAYYVHEAKKPGEGEYWTGGRGFGRGWTTLGTGNKYVQKPVDDNREWIPKTLTDRLDRELRRYGL